MRLRYLVSFLMLFTFQCILSKKPYRAVIAVPIADAVGSPIQSFFPHLSPEQGYAHLPVCGEKPFASSCCPRLHQLLFNEMVTVIKEQGVEVLVTISNCFFVSKQNNAPQNSYWILKKNIVALKELSKAAISLDDVPPALSFEDQSSAQPDQVVTLRMPWYDTVTNQTFSAGTRFVLEKQSEENDELYVIKVVDFHNKTCHSVTINKDLLVFAPTTIAEKRALFIEILKQWAHLPNGVIVYVWGGCSFTTTVQDARIAIQKNKSLPCSFYHIDQFDQVPKPGLDCSNLIMRAAQIAGIPFFLKNSYTIGMYMKPLADNQSLENGDIIAIPGHVMVVADITRNTIIEARGYKKGQGKVQEIALDKVFKNIKTFKQLAKVWRDTKPLERLADDGTHFETIKQFKLLSMQSVFGE